MGAWRTHSTDLHVPGRGKRRPTFPTGDPEENWGAAHGGGGSYTSPEDITCSPGRYWPGRYWVVSGKLC